MVLDQPDSPKATERLFEEYVSNVQPALLLAERCHGGTLPLAFSLEFRSIVTHIYRAEARRGADRPLSAEDERAIEDELEKAGRHLLRIRLDCLKLICISLEEQAQDAITSMDRECPLRYIDDGGFLADILRIQGEARICFDAAKNADCEGGPRTLDLYERASSLYWELATLVGLSFTNAPPSERIQRYRSLCEEERKAKRRGWALFFAGLIVAFVGFMLEVS